MTIAKRILKINKVFERVKLADINDFDVDVICIEDLKYDLDVEFDIIGSSGDVFSIMFTSGTTGLPKGVLISNKVLTGVGVGMKEICNSSPGMLQDVITVSVSVRHSGYILYCIMVKPVGYTMMKREMTACCLLKHLKTSH